MNQRDVCPWCLGKDQRNQKLEAFVAAYDEWQKYARLGETKAKDRARMMMVKARKALGGAT